MEIYFKNNRVGSHSQSVVKIEGGKEACAAAHGRTNESACGRILSGTKASTHHSIFETDTVRKKIIHDRTGFTLLLMVVLLAAFLSISMGIVNILFGQIIIIGQAGESFNALYIADRGIERVLYRDRIQNICGGTSCNENLTIGTGACYATVVVIGPSAGCVGSTRCMNVLGKDQCVGTNRFVERRFDIRY